MPFSFFKKVTAKYEGGKAALEVLKGEPYKLSSERNKGYVEIEFYRYLEEPNLVLTFETLKEGNFLLEYNPRIGEWTKR